MAEVETLLGVGYTVDIDGSVVTLDFDDIFTVRLPAALAGNLAIELYNAAVRIVDRGDSGRDRDVVAGKAGRQSGETDGEAEDAGVPVDSPACSGACDGSGACGCPRP